MSLVHNGITLFGLDTHGDLIKGSYDKRLQIFSPFGVRGEAHIVDETKGRDLMCVVEFMEYSTPGGLASAITAIQKLANPILHGPLVITHAGNDPVTFNFCTFLEATEQTEIIPDAATGTYWTKVNFIWRQAQ